MKKGIAKRLFIYIILVVLGTSVLILLSNSLLLSPLYYSSVRNSMVSAAAEIAKIDFSQDSENWIEQIGDVTTGHSYGIAVKSGEDVLFSSSSAIGLMPRPAPRREAAPDAPTQQDRRTLAFREHEDWELISDDIYLGMITVPGSGADMMVCKKELGDDITVFLTQPLEPINQSIRQANILLIACSALSLVISAVFVLKVSKRFTEPVRQIQSKVEEIANLRFHEECSVKTGDELESLCDGVNALSEKLEGALKTLRLQNTRLEKDIEVQRQFLSNASHELRTPLSLIKGYADELNTGYAKDAAQQKLYIDIIAKEAAKMNRLIKEMLDLSRMESGRVELQNEVLCVGERIQAFLEKYDGYIRENGLDISTEYANGAVGIFDAMYFEQVLANYISNAARYGDSQKKIRIWTRITGDSVRVSVFNTGKRIDESFQSEIWNGFSMADKARTRSEGSYGLGLSVVKAIQTLAGQRFGVENAEGGVVFWFDVRRFKENA